MSAARRSPRKCQAVSRLGQNDGWGRGADSSWTATAAAMSLTMAAPEEEGKTAKASRRSATDTHASRLEDAVSVGAFVASCAVFLYRCIALDPMPVVHALGSVAFTLGLATNALTGIGQTRPAGRYVGRWIFLTTQTNLLGSVYYGLWVASPLIGSAALDAALRRWFAPMWALGAFLTLAYYGLDHFNPKNAAMRSPDHPLYHPWRNASNHAKHICGLPAVTLHAVCARWVAGPGAPAWTTRTDALQCLGGYLAAYIAFCHVNFMATRAWPYPLLDDATRVGGAALRTLVLFVLVIVLEGLAMIGVLIV